MLLKIMIIFIFVFLNTKPFCENLKNIIHIPIIIDLSEKVEFINTCDAMIWGRSDRETFGIAIGEFSTKNKPVLCCNVGYDGHYNLLQNKALWYHENNLKDMLINFNKELIQKNDWNAYKDYTPEKVMKIFKNIFIDSE